MGIKLESLNDKVELSRITYEFFLAEVKACHAMLNAVGAPTFVLGDGGVVVKLTLSQRLKLYLQESLPEANEHPHAPH